MLKRSLLRADARRYLGSLRWHQCRPCRLPRHFYYCHPPEGWAVFISCCFFSLHGQLRLIFRDTVWYFFRTATHCVILRLSIFLFFVFFGSKLAPLHHVASDRLWGWYRLWFARPRAQNLSVVSIISVGWHHRLSSVTIPLPQTKAEAPFSSQKPKTRFSHSA